MQAASKTALKGASSLSRDEGISSLVLLQTQCTAAAAAVAAAAVNATAAVAAVTAAAAATVWKRLSS